MNDDELQNLDEIEAALVRAGLGEDALGDTLVRLRLHLERYASLEKELLGHVTVSLPAHLLALELPDAPIAAGELLAARERERLGLGRAETGDMAALLDREGLKVYRPRFPAGIAVEGLFLFDAEVGPVLAADGRLPVLETDFVFARLYAHYLVDNDPYRIRFAMRGGGTGASESDLRAQAFAAAFLVDREGLESYLSALGREEGDALGIEDLRQLAVFFEVGYRPLVARLLAAGRLAADEVPALLAAARAEDEPAADLHESTTLGERFVRLALEAHARGLFELPKLAEHLETDEETAGRLADRFDLKATAEDAGGERTHDADDEDR